MGTAPADSGHVIFAARFCDLKQKVKKQPHAQ